MIGGLAVAIVSGGLDSVTLAHLLQFEQYKLHLVAFDYGQRHNKEIGYASGCATRLGATMDVIDLRSVGQRLTGSSLTDSIPVPDGHYEAESMRVTVVPNRNAIMLSIAYGIAVARGATVVATGVHSGDHFIYPDCRQEFIEAFDAMQRLAVAGFGHPDLHLLTPFVGISKAQIVKLGADLGVPFASTWSCYKGGDLHCGTCGTCVERIEAFQHAGVPDPTPYMTDR